MTATLQARVELGSIFCWTWGYDQTNVDFFEVVGKSGSMLTVRQLATNERTETDGQYYDRALPVPGEYIGESRRKKLLSMPDGRVYLKQPYGWCDLWDGRAVGRTWGA